ncbi:hypothetical protein CVD23_16035 [Bacillus sp. V33-4]|nr:hypothetical protein CVD23_16035 [Bacillus sp. V33-4]
MIVLMRRSLRKINNESVSGSGDKAYFYVLVKRFILILLVGKEQPIIQVAPDLYPLHLGQLTFQMTILLV